MSDSPIIPTTDRFGGNYIAHRGRTGLSVVCMDCSAIVYHVDDRSLLAPGSAVTRDGVAAIEAHRCDGAAVQ